MGKRKKKPSKRHVRANRGSESPRRKLKRGVFRFLVKIGAERRRDGFAGWTMTKKEMREREW